MSCMTKLRQKLQLSKKKCCPYSLRRNAASSICFSPAWRASSGIKRFQLRSKMPHRRRLPGDFITLQRVPGFIDFSETLDNVVCMALCINTAWHGQPHEVHGCRFLRSIGLAAKHQGTDLDTANAARYVQCDRK